MAPALQHQPPRAIGYVRVSTDEQVSSGLGLAAQRAAIEAEAGRRGWDLDVLADEGLSAKDLNRPALTAALDRLDRRQADVLVVAKLDRLSRSVGDFGALLDRAARRGWSVVCLDLGVDTTTPVGEFTANVVVSAAQYERRLIGQRTRDALAAARARGTRLGRPQALSGDVVARVVGMRRDGASFRAIAERLQADGVPTARGGATWHASTVKAVCESQAAAGVS
ncbi:recombinase family protein [Blastococcus saxobsidens]|uniref:DNA invertase Pin-like site-specific DNA recombinase n=1 Tax=Blastococcus saxobsidens TaxID=138336 RepID=A0A4Q7Y3U7_9ACTN|nr:recombinase family protein [Blastococcus saxobsidens]RZU30469.1 DNA invertase Pin-like site-specific DNA recombinase [Blastococcus saxobsidens]